MHLFEYIKQETNKIHDRNVYYLYCLQLQKDEFVSVGCIWFPENMSVLIRQVCELKTLYLCKNLVQRKKPFTAKLSKKNLRNDGNIRTIFCHGHGTRVGASTGKIFLRGYEI